MRSIIKHTLFNFTTMSGRTARTHPAQGIQWRIVTDNWSCSDALVLLCGYFSRLMLSSRRHQSSRDQVLVFTVVFRLTCSWCIGVKSLVVAMQRFRFLWSLWRSCSIVAFMRCGVAMYGRYLLCPLDCFVVSVDSLDLVLRLVNGLCAWPSSASVQWSVHAAPACLDADCLSFFCMLRLVVVFCMFRWWTFMVHGGAMI